MWWWRGDDFQRNTWGRETWWVLNEGGSGANMTRRTETVSRVSGSMRQAESCCQQMGLEMKWSGQIVACVDEMEGHGNEGMGNKSKKLGPLGKKMGLVGVGAT